MKVNLTLSVIAAVASFLASIGGATWFAAAKNNDLDHLRHDVERVVAADSEQEKTLSKLDERTVLILDSVRRIEERR